MQLGCNPVCPKLPRGAPLWTRGEKAGYPTNCLDNVILDLQVNRLMTSANRSALKQDILEN